MTPEDAIARLIDLFRTRDDLRKVIEDQGQQYGTIWAQDADAIGRVLRAHLAVEHFLTAYIQAQNPNLGKLNNARLTFAQKANLLGESDPLAGFLKPGLKRLNEIRNRIAHKLRNVVDEGDREAFLTMQLFVEIRTHLASRFGVMMSEDPLSVVEDFARLASAILHAAAHPSREFWIEVLGELFGQPASTVKE